MTRFGVFAPQGWRLELREVEDPFAQYEVLSRCAQEAEAAGLDSVWVYDHFHTVPRAEIQPTFEAWTTLAALARDTHRVRLGQLVTCNEYRPPQLVAKMASCIDVISGGRLVVGMGAGWYGEEFAAYGYDFPATPDRLRHLREGVQVMRAMWTEERASFEGRYYTVRDAVCEPKPLQRPLPLWIGGGGERVTLRLVARFADGCNLVGDPSTVRHKLEVLRGHCEDVDRDPRTVTRSTELTVVIGGEAELRRVAEMAGRSLEDLRAMPQMVAGPAEQVAARIRQYVEAGIEYVIVFLPLVADGGEIRRFADEVVPLVG